MKLFIIKERYTNEIEIHIDEHSVVENIKNKIEEDFYRKTTFKFIYKNVILTSHNSLKYYKICENDEIWFGEVQKYLTADDVIVYVFLVGKHQDYDFMIFKNNDTISTVKSMLEKMYPKVIDMWNADGELMEDDQRVSEIDTFKDYKLFIKCDDGEGNKNIFTFKECSLAHNTRWVDRYLFVDKFRDENKNELIRMNFLKIIEKIRQIILSNDIVDDRLNQNFSDMPSSYLDSLYFLTGDLGIPIYCIYCEYHEFLRNYCQCRDDVMEILDKYLFFAIRASLVDFVNSRKEIGKITDKSIKCIIIDVLNYFKNYLIDSSNDWKYWLQIWINQYKVGSFTEYQVEQRINACNETKFKISIKIGVYIYEKFTTINPRTVGDAKKNISDLLKLDEKDIYCIKPEKDRKPNDEDPFDDYFIEIVFSMNGIKGGMRELGKGAFARISRCLDQTTSKTIALKKPRLNDQDIYRNLTIYAKLKSSRIIMNYLGLFRYKGEICIGMDYMPGGTLKSYWKSKVDLSEEEIVKMAFEILTQINELHKLGIIHRDIKSENVVLDEHNQAKLIDFGSSKSTSGSTSEDLLVHLQSYPFGTLENNAPELFNRETYSEKIDIWSFGIMLVEVVTRKEPFREFTESEIPQAINEYKFEPKEEISSNLNSLIELCLTKNPDERPSAEELIEYLLEKFKYLSM